jgi:hypothetical protein
VDTSEQTAVETTKQVLRQRRSVLRGRRVGGAGSAPACGQRQPGLLLAQEVSGRAAGSRFSKLLPVTVSDIPWSKSEQGRGASTRGISGAMEMQLPKGQLRVTGRVDAEALRTVLECLLG